MIDLTDHQQAISNFRVSVLLLAVVSAPTAVFGADGNPGRKTAVGNINELCAEPEVNQRARLKSSQEKEAGRVLRHAVFFSFKDKATPEDIKSVVDAFRSLPEKIDTIIDFQWGTNNSPEKLDDGFTHCFLLTFKDEAGRQIYLPHPDHKAFGALLRPHLKDVFVVDYWGTHRKEPLKNQLKHAVFFKFKETSKKRDVNKVERSFAALADKIDSIKEFEWGTNNSPETHDDGFTHCFMVTFDSENGRETYLPHPEHKAFVEVLKPHLERVRVLDFWAHD